MIINVTTSKHNNSDEDDVLMIVAIMMMSKCYGFLLLVFKYSHFVFFF